MSNETTTTEVKKPTAAPEAYNVRLPRNAYKLRVFSAENDKTKKPPHSRMAVIDCEIIENEPVAHEGKPVDINGLTLKHWSVVTEKSLKFANNCRAAFGLRDLVADDIDIFDARDFLGRVGYAICVSTLEPQINEVTKEPVLNPYDKTPMMTVRREIVEWIPKPAGYE